MTQPDQDRIKLAEAMGWKPLGGEWDKKGDPPAWEGPDIIGAFYDLPDPFTDANDCEALIRWLNEQGYQVQVIFGFGVSDQVWIGHNKIQIGEVISDWMHGVCELALKVIDE